MRGSGDATLDILANMTTLILLDIGLPMIFVAIPVMAVALVPIVCLEAIVLRYYIGITYKQATKASALTNIASTLLGIPMSWLLLVLIQTITGGDRAYGLKTPLTKFLAVTWQAPWLIPYESDLYWMIPAAGLFLLIPFFFVSWYVEYLVARRILKDLDPISTRRGVRNANIASYGLLALYLATVLVTAKPRG
jgi:hypothetical protein